MLRKLLSITTSLTARRANSYAYLTALDWSSTAAPFGDQALDSASNNGESAADAATAPLHRPRPFGNPSSATNNVESIDKYIPSPATSVSLPEDPFLGARKRNAAPPRPPTQKSPLAEGRLVKLARNRWIWRFRRLAANKDYAACFESLKLENLRQLKLNKLTFAFEEAVKVLPPPQALQAYQMSRDQKITPSVAMAVAIIRIYGQLGMLRHIDGFLRDAIAAGLKQHWSLYFHWANVFAEAGQAEGVRAAAAAAEAAGMEVTAHYQTLMVKALCKAGQAGRTLIFFRGIRESGQVPPEPVWRALIHCHGQSGYAARAQALFDEMQSEGIVPGLATWTALVNAYAECRMPREAVETLEQMHNAGLKGNTQTYTVLLKACAHSGDVAAAQTAVEQMRKDGLQPTVHVWGALIAACASAGDTAAARAAFKAMKESGCAVSVVQYTALLMAYRHAGDIAGGLQVLQEMDADGIKPGKEAYTELITLLGQDGMITEAEEAFLAMKSDGYAPDQIAYNVLTSTFMTNWVDNGRKPDSPLLLRAEEVYKEGLPLGRTRSPRELCHNGKLFLIDLHCQGTWSAQFAVLSAFAEISAIVQGNMNVSTMGIGGEGTDGLFAKKVPALMLITGHGLKKGWAPLRETVIRLLHNMGIHVRVAAGNGGTLIVNQRAVKLALKKALWNNWKFDAVTCSQYLVDPREVVAQQDDEEKWGRLDNGWKSGEISESEDEEEVEREGGRGRRAALVGSARRK